MYAPRDLGANDNLSMTLRVLRAFGLLVSLVLALTACGSGRDNPPDTRVRIINVAPSYSSLYFSRERTPALNASFNGAAEPSTPYDEDTYDFYVYQQDLSTGRANSTPILSFAKHVVTGTFYTFVLFEAGGAVENSILESPPVLATATDTQVQLLHAAENVPAVDVYLEPPGAVIAGATPWSSVSFRSSSAASNVAAGEYELTITAAGNPAAVLLTSVVFTLAAAQSTTFVISPDGGTGLGQLAVAIVQSGGGGVLIDRNAQSSVRVLNAPTDKTPRDVAFNGQFTPPLFSAAPFASPTARAPLAPGSDIPLNVTPVGNPGVLELDQKVIAVGGNPYTLLLSGDAGALIHAFVIDDIRRIGGVAKIRFYDAAPQFAAAELVLVPPGIDPANAYSVAFLLPGTVGTPVEVLPGTYDLYVRLGATNTLLAGPLAVTLLERGLYGVLATNGADTATADVTLIDDFQ
jgi:hypothetical protein